MASSHERNRSKDIILTPLGRRVKRAVQLSGILAVGATVGIAAFGTNGTSRAPAEMTPVSAVKDPSIKELEAMDSQIAHELSKGPQGDDLIVNDGQTFTIGPSDNVASAMTRVHRGANPSGQSIIQTKATTASAENFKPSSELFPEDEGVIWQDAELTRRYGERTLLAARVERPEY